MRSCFSTLGCPDWTADQVVDCVRDLGFEGIEIRGLQGEMHLPDSPHLAPGSDFLAALAAASCKVVVLGSSASFGKGQPAVDECNAFADCAARIGAPIVRVFGGNIADGQTREEALEVLAPALRSACEHAASVGVTVGLETHDAWCRGDACAVILQAVDHPSLKIVWDAHHSYRHGETPAQTLDAIGEHIIHVHLKDGLWEDGRSRYTLFGEGDVPWIQMLQGLKDAGYNGYLSLEWEKKWHPELPEPEVAFPQYASKLQEMLTQLH